MSTAVKIRDIKDRGARYAKARERAEKLADNFSRISGSVYMSSYICQPKVPPGENRTKAFAEMLKEGRGNPCGTAACIAGKAAVAGWFEDEGYHVDPQDPGIPTSVSPASFFGIDLSQSVFVGAWCLCNIHTSRHAELVLRDFLNQWGIHNFEDSAIWDRHWVPSDECAKEILRTAPKTKSFPVSGRFGVASSVGSDINEPGATFFKYTSVAPVRNLRSLCLECKLPLMMWRFGQRRHLKCAFSAVFSMPFERDRGYDE